MIITPGLCLLKERKSCFPREWSLADRLAGYRLKSNSPAINSGLLIENNGGKDFWGNTLGSEYANIGVSANDTN